MVLIYTYLLTLDVGHLFFMYVLIYGLYSLLSQVCIKIVCPFGENWVVSFLTVEF